MRMSGTWRAVELMEGFYWVGAVDWDLRDFHGYSTHRGTTYNAFLLKGRETVLFDTVKAPFFDQMMERIASVADPSSVSVIVSNHSEMDHSGSLPAAVAAMKPGRVIASSAGAKNLSMQLGLEGIEVAADGSRTEAGDAELVFMETKMLHWPDSMFTYIPSRKLLISQDAFGMHLATARLFADENEESVLLQEAGRYYANILMPYSQLVEKLLAKVASAGLDMDVIAPDHGPLWRTGTTTGPEWIVGRYARWAAQAPGSRVVIAYDTMWRATEKMAHAIAEGAAAGGAIPLVCSLRSSHRSDIAAELLDAGALMLGSPTLNGNMFPTVSDLVCYLGGLKRRNLAGGAFGSYGWSGESVRQLEEALTGMKVRMLGSVACQFGPDASALSRCRDLGLAAAASVSGPAGPRT